MHAECGGILLKALSNGRSKVEFAIISPNNVDNFIE